MTEHEYNLSGCRGYHCKFEFMNGNVMSGVIDSFLLFDRVENFYLVTTPNMRDLQPFKEKNDRENMVKFITQVDLATIASVTRLN